MTKNLSLTALFFLAAIGCSKVVDNILIYDSDDINFEAQTTKVTDNDLEALQDDASGFVVYGLLLNSSSWYNNLDGVSYVYDPELQVWGWGLSESPSWPDPFIQMNFYAYYPKEALGFELTSSAPATIVGEITTQPSILDQVDYLASASGDVTSKPVTGMQPLRFEHIMSKVSFSVVQNQGVLTVIRQLGIENIINKGSYDYVNSLWYNLSNNNIGSFSDYVGSAGPFSKYGVENQADPVRIDGHYLMLVPQKAGQGAEQVPLWDGEVAVDESGEGVTSGAYISIRYRTSSQSDTQDHVGYAIRETSTNETEWDEKSYYYSVYKKNGGSYTGPLYVKAGFKLSSEQLNWEAGSEYDYTLYLNKTGGVYLSEYYYDVDGTNTKIRVTGSPAVGDTLYNTDVSIGVTVSGWNYYEYECF